MRMLRRPKHPLVALTVLGLCVGLCTGCGASDGSRRESGSGPADLILHNGSVYTLAWDDPGPDGTPAADAPFLDGEWQADASAVAARDGEIVYVGDDVGALELRGPETRVIDVEGATVLPGLVESHAHFVGLGRNLRRVDLLGVETEVEAVDRVAAHAATVPAGEWIVGWGFDDGAWAGRYPDAELLSSRVPDHPVALHGLHGFATWGNRLAFERAGITAATDDPVGGEIVRDASGEPSGILLNRASGMLDSAVPPSSPEQLESEILAGLAALIASGYVAVHEAGVGEGTMRILEELASAGRLPMRVYAMLSARDPVILERYREAGPTVHEGGMLIVRSVKAYYDAALGSRGARMLEDYSDMPGHRGVSGEGYGYDRDAVESMMVAGFQVGIHAIGDAGNRETLDFLEEVFSRHPETRAARHRIEHAQVLHADDLPRLAELDVIASMEPPHAVEDKAWAVERVGPERVRGAYAWRSLRAAGTRITFNSDLPGSDHSIFYGLHAAVTRRDPDLQPANGWYPEERMQPEEAVRAYTVWAAYAGGLEQDSGTIEVGKRADLTVLSPDPLALPLAEYGEILDGRIEFTVIGGRVAYSR